MKKTILELTNDEARKYFLQASKFCTIDLPKYFDFQPLLNNLEKQIANQKLFNIQKTTPKDCENVNYKFLTNKDGNFAWRPLQIINPAIYICLVNRITEATNWEIIKKRFSKFQSNNNIKCYSIPLQTDENYNQLKSDATTNIINWWEQIEQQSIELALQYNCVLTTDITDCYGSIYTHSIAWALHGKEEARKQRNENPPTIIGGIIDDIIQTMSYRQTNGIPQGSVLMDFISEMVLGYADAILSVRINRYNLKNKILNDAHKCSDNQITDYKILRYRDDYRIFTNTQENAVKIAKILSEVLSELNLQINKQKTFVSNNIIRDVIKPDKLYWNEAKQGEKTLQNHLLLIYSLAEKYPNSGTISTALSKFINRIFPLAMLKEDNPNVLISILVDIAYNNPRTYSAVIVCIGKLLSIETSDVEIDKIFSLIKKKFENKPNVGHWKVWFQRLTIKANREQEKGSDEKLCQIAANNTNVQLWNIDWLNSGIQQKFKDNSIFNEDVFNSISEIPDKSEAQLFNY